MQNRERKYEVIDMSCNMCNLSRECRGPVWDEYGLSTPVIMIVGEAPGIEEDIKKRPFVGRAGKLLFDALKKFGFEREDFLIANCVKCYPARTKTPKYEHIDFCAGMYLDSTIKIMKPSLVLSLGNTPLYFFTGRKGGVMSMNGRFVRHPVYKTWIMYCIHPANVLRNPRNTEMFYDAIERFCNEANNIKKEVNIDAKAV